MLLLPSFVCALAGEVDARFSARRRVLFCRPSLPFWQFFSALAHYWGLGDDTVWGQKDLPVTQFFFHKTVEVDPRPGICTPSRAQGAESEP